MFAQSNSSFSEYSNGLFHMQQDYALNKLLLNNEIDSNLLFIGVSSLDYDFETQNTSLPLYTAGVFLPWSDPFISLTQVSFLPYEHIDGINRSTPGTPISSGGQTYEWTEVSLDRNYGNAAHADYLYAFQGLYFNDFLNFELEVEIDGGPHYTDNGRYEYYSERITYYKNIGDPGQAPEIVKDFTLEREVNYGDAIAFFSLAYPLFFHNSEGSFTVKPLFRQFHYSFYDILDENIWDIDTYSYTGPHSDVVNGLNWKSKSYDYLQRKMALEFAYQSRIVEDNSFSLQGAAYYSLQEVEKDVAGGYIYEYDSFDNLSVSLSTNYSSYLAFGNAITFGLGIAGGGKVDFDMDYRNESYERAALRMHYETPLQITIKEGLLEDKTDRLGFLLNSRITLGFDMVIADSPVRLFSAISPHFNFSVIHDYFFSAYYKETIVERNISGEIVGGSVSEITGGMTDVFSTIDFVADLDFSFGCGVSLADAFDLAVSITLKELLIPAKRGIAGRVDFSINL